MAGTPAPLSRLRSPVGTYTRDTPDWFINQYALWGGEFSPSSNTFAIVGVFNDAMPGSVLLLYDVYLGTNSIAPCVTGLINGTQAGVTFNAPVTGALNPLNAVVYGATFSGSLPMFSVKGQLFAWGGFNGGALEWPHEHPFAIIPAGYSFYAASVTVSTVIWFRFGWINLPG